MSRQGSASTVDVTSRKGIGRLPKEGSVLRKYYDTFLAHPGEVVSLMTEDANMAYSVIDQLENYYGLVFKKTAGRARILIGRYVGSEYHAYEVKQNAEISSKQGN